MDRKISELISENDYLRTIINSANEGIYVTDRARKFLVWNDAAEGITGYCSADVLGNFCFGNLLDHVDESGMNLCLTGCPLEKSMTTGRPQGPSIVFLRHKDGHRIPVEVRTAPMIDKEGEIIGSVEVFQDISDRIEREKVLTERKKKLETVMDNICDGVLFIDEEGKISLFNRALADTLLLPKDLLGAKIFSLPLNNPLREAIFRVDKEFRGPFCWELFGCAEDVACSANRTNNGRCWLGGASCIPRRSSSCRACPVYHEMKRFLERPKELAIGTKLFSVLSSFIELADKNRILEVIVFKEVTHEKLDAVMALAGAAAHELRQPLQIIASYIHLMKDDLNGNEIMDRYYSAIEEGCLRMDGIIKKLCNITQYKVINYAEDIKILDITKSSGNPQD